MGPPNKALLSPPPKSQCQMTAHYPHICPPGEPIHRLLEDQVCLLLCLLSRWPKLWLPCHSLTKPMSECKDLLGEAQNCLAAAVVALLKAPPPSAPAAGLSALRVAPRCLLGFQDHCDKELMHTQVALQGECPFI